MNKPLILATNIDQLEKGQKASDFEISVGVLPTEINKENPTLYAFRTGRIYDPNDSFNPVEGNGAHALPTKLHEPFYNMLSEARKNLAKLKAELVGNTPTKKEGETVEMEQLKILAKTQEYRINELLNSKNEEHSQEMKELKELLQAKTKELEALKAGETNEVRHEKFDDIVTILKLKMAVYLYGPAGTGKSAMAKQIAKYLKLKFYPMSTITQEFKFTGYQDGNGLYHDTNFYKAVKNGGVFFIDEMDSCSSDVLIGLNACLANGYFDFPHETIECHENFVVISAGNTTGHGANADYVGRQQLDLSTLDRFLSIKINYDTNIDLAVAKNDTDLVNFAHALRKASEQTEITILMSYRAIGNIAKLIEFFDLPKIMDMAVIKGMPVDEVKMLAGNMNIDSSNKYYKAFKRAVA
jgi:cobaltochelatase CobS